jgi:hypothetical protein
VADRIRLFIASPMEASDGGVLQMARSNWILPGAWLWLRLYDILFFLTAGVGWVDMVLRLRRTPPEQLTPGTVGFFWLLILLPAFALQNILFILADLTGSSSDINNLQIRLIPLTASIAAPTATYVLLRVISRLRQSQVHYRTFRAAMMAFMLLALALGLIKGSSEPMFSNAWFFYSIPEKTAVQWMHARLPLTGFEFGRTAPRVWLGPDFRLGGLWLQNYWGTNRNLIPSVADPLADHNYIFFSPGTHFVSERKGVPMPDVRQASLIYTNGAVKIYYQQPEKR